MGVATVLDSLRLWKRYHIWGLGVQMRTTCQINVAP